MHSAVTRQLRQCTALCLLFIACDSEVPMDDTGHDARPAEAMVGVHHIFSQWDEEALVDELDPGFLRINFQHDRVARAVEKDNWRTLDAVVDANAHRRILATVYPRDEQGQVDTNTFLEQAAVLAARYGDAIEYWQLDNEPAFSSDRWKGFDVYADLLGDFAEVIRTEDPDGDIVLGGLAGFHYSKLSGLEQELLVAVASDPEAATVDVVDLHHHRFWHEGATTRQQLAVTRAFIESEAPALRDARYLITENSTYAGSPAGFPPQIPLQQAAFNITSVLAALSSGAEACVFGVMMDRPQWAGNTAPHPFNLNGLFYNPSKDYGDEMEHSGPKPVARAHAVLGALLEGLRPRDLNWVEHADGAIAVELGTRGTVVWADQDMTHTLGRAGAALTLTEIENLEVGTMSVDSLAGSGTQRSSVDLSAGHPVVVLWE